jgi:hypothetical protein
MIGQSLHPPLTDKIQKIAKKHSFHSYYTSKGTLGDHLINLKDKRENRSKTGIYEIECKTCKKKYRGQSKRRVFTRWEEHDRACRLNHPSHSAVAAHCLQYGHEIGEKKLSKEVTDWKN